jgi:hypothetical protein
MKLNPATLQELGKLIFRNTDRAPTNSQPNMRKAPLGAKKIYQGL